MRHRITAVVPLPETRLLLTFANGKRRVFDVSPYLDKDIFTQLRNPGLFRKGAGRFRSRRTSERAGFQPGHALFAQRPGHIRAGSRRSIITV